VRPGDEHVELALLGPQLNDVDMDVADGIAFEPSRPNRPEAVRSDKIWNICERVAVSCALYLVASLFRLGIRGNDHGFRVHGGWATFVR